MNEKIATLLAFINIVDDHKKVGVFWMGDGKKKIMLLPWIED